MTFQYLEKNKKTTDELDALRAETKALIGGGVYIHISFETSCHYR